MSDTGCFRSFYGAATSVLSVGWIHSIHTAGGQKKQIVQIEIFSQSIVIRNIVE